MVMHQADSAFFDAYKRLERFCSDRYSEQSGVSAYIAEMEACAARGRASVPSWNADYQGLKHIRWVRNRIAHEAEAGRLSEDGDLSFAQDFYRRLQAEKDPLALLRKAEQPRRSAPKEQKEKASPPSPQPRSAGHGKKVPSPRTARSSPKPRASRAAPVPVLIGCILLLLLLFGMIYMNYR